MFKNKYEKTCGYLIYQDDEDYDFLKDDKENEEGLSKLIEKEYLNSRKDMLLNGMRDAKTSEDFLKAALVLIGFFFATTVYNILYTFGNPGLTILSSPLFISNTVSFISGMILNSISSVYGKHANEVLYDVKQVDKFMNLKEECNTDEVHTVIEKINPTLFEIIKKSQLSKPVDLNLFNQMKRIERKAILDKAEEIRKKDEEDNGVKYIDLFSVENELILDEAVKRKIIKCYDKRR